MESRSQRGKEPSVSVIALVGPTAVGKSGVAIALAHSQPDRHLEIINADAYALYCGMDIGTAKTLAADRGGVNHHLFDLWPISQPASVLTYRQAARAAVIETLDRGGQPMLVGGSGLYLTAALDDLDIPPTDPALRAELNARLAAEGPAHLYLELQERDPQAAASIEPANGRRIVRALEVVLLTGRFRSTLPQPIPSWRRTEWIGLTAPLDVLDERIERRTQQMWAAGFVAEVEGLIELGLANAPTAKAAVGYSECIAYLAGELTRPAAIERTVARTRKLARRQLRWFRRDSRVNWLDVTEGDVVEQIQAMLPAQSRAAD